MVFFLVVLMLELCCFSYLNDTQIPTTHHTRGYSTVSAAGVNLSTYNMSFATTIGTFTTACTKCSQARQCISALAYVDLNNQTMAAACGSKAVHSYLLSCWHPQHAEQNSSNLSDHDHQTPAHQL
jgi:hypothetical protein